jgi:hypothetical protein
VAQADAVGTYEASSRPDRSIITNSPNSAEDTIADPLQIGVPAPSRGGPNGTSSGHITARLRTVATSFQGQALETATREPKHA